jgi:hypothetical protein
MHIAVADGRQRLDREIEQIEIALAGDVGDRLIAERIEQREDCVERTKISAAEPKNTGQ